MPENKIIKQTKKDDGGLSQDAASTKAAGRPNNKPHTQGARAQTRQAHARAGLVTNRGLQAVITRRSHGVHDMQREVRRRVQGHFGIADDFEL